MEAWQSAGVMGAPADLLAAWGIVRVSSVAVPATGTMNETWIVEYGGGKVVLRRHRPTARPCVEYEHEVIALAAAAGIPTPGVVPLLDGSQILEADGRLHSVYEHAEGIQIPLAEITDPKAESMGLMLAAIHDALEPMAPSPAGPDRLSSVAVAVNAIEEMGRSIEAKHGPGSQPSSLRAREAWLTELDPRDLRDPAGSIQTIHGDYQLTNVFFAGDAVSAVIDWDRARQASPAVEVIRAMHHGLGMRASLCRRFLHGYRSRRALPAGELHDAARWFGVQQAMSLWLLELKYLRESTPALEGLVEADTFTPFATRWAQLGLT